MHHNRLTPLSTRENGHDPARAVKIDYELQYTECDLADERFENHPVLQLFYSSHLIRSEAHGGITNIPLDEHHLSNVYRGSLSASLSRRHMDGIPARAAIGIDSYAVHYDQHGNQCFVNVGTSHAYLSDILEEVRTKGAYDHQHDLLMRTTIVGVGEQVKKGSIQLKVINVQLGPALHGASIVASPLQAPIGAIETHIGEYIQQCMQMETALPDLLDGTERIRAPMDISQVGIESTGSSFLPIAAFAMIETPESNPEFFRNALSMVMKRRGMERKHFARLPEKEKCRYLGLMISFGVQTFSYIGDSVELGTSRKKQGGTFSERLLKAHAMWVERASSLSESKRQNQGTEEFSNIWTTIAGDCEDSAMGINATLMAFRHQTQFDPREDADLLELQKIACDYHAFLTLAVVHGQKIGDHEGRGAHMFLELPPKHQVFAALERTASGRAFLQRLNPSTRTPDYTAFTGDAISKDSLNLMQRRPSMFCEGTGHIDPIGESFPQEKASQQLLSSELFCEGEAIGREAPADQLFPKRAYVAQNMNSISAFKTLIPHNEYGDSTFYLCNELAVNSDWVKSTGIGAFVYGTVNPNYSPDDPSNAHEMSRGVLYTDMLRNSPNMALMPQPPMSSELLSIIDEANALSPPPRPLVLDHSKPVLGEERNPLLDRFVQHVQSLERGSALKNQQSVDAYILPTQLNPNQIDAMINDAINATRLIEARYCKEQVTNTIYLYRLQLFIQ